MFWAHLNLHVLESDCPDPTVRTQREEPIPSSLNVDQERGAECGGLSNTQRDLYSRLVQFIKRRPSQIGQG